MQYLSSSFSIYTFRPTENLGGGGGRGYFPGVPKIVLRKGGLFYF